MRLTKHPAVDTVRKELHEEASCFREGNSMRAAGQRLFGIVILTILFAATTYADTFTFSTVPGSGNLSAAAGSTVGWGYSVTNNSLTQWLVFASLDPSASFANGTANADVFDFPIVAPLSTLTQAYDGTNGLYEFTWNAGAPAGSSNSGNFVLGAEWWSGDPFDPIAPGKFLTAIPAFNAPYSVTVAASCECTPVPESSSLPMLACGVAGLLLFGLNRKQLPLRF
jgi:hypothetical protein